MNVPILNMYYLLCYAWNMLHERELVEAGALQGTNVANLLGTVLDRGLARLLARGINRTYVDVVQTETRVRGKLLLTPTLTSPQFFAGRATCASDALVEDTPHNRVIKAAARKLVVDARLDPGLRRALEFHCARLHGVSDVRLSPATFRGLRVHRDVSHYSLLLETARLVAASFMPNSSGGLQRFVAFTFNDSEMGRLFQAFVHNFLDREQYDYSVTRRHVPWNLTGHLEHDSAWLPRMETDVLLTNRTTRLLIETKCYATPYQSYRDVRKLRSDHLYQILAYVSNLAATPGPAPIGLLLYAGSGDDLQMRFQLAGHPIYVRTLDLNQPWQEIQSRLLSTVSSVVDDVATHNAAGMSGLA